MDTTTTSTLDQLAAAIAARVDTVTAGAVELGPDQLDAAAALDRAVVLLDGGEGVHALAMLVRARQAVKGDDVRADALRVRIGRAEGYVSALNLARSIERAPSAFHVAGV